MSTERGSEDRGQGWGFEARRGAASGVLGLAGHGSTAYGYIAVAVSTVLICAPFVRHIGMLGDEGLLLHGAQRMLLGEVVYRDFFEMLPPLGFAATAAWMAVVGDSLVAMRAMAIAAIVLIALLSFHACRSLTHKDGWSALVVLAWVLASQGVWTIVNHHWFTTAYSMGALVALLGVLQGRVSPLPGALVAGICVGAAGMTTSARGAAVASAAALILLTSPAIPRRALWSFAAGMALIPALLALWLGWQGALDDGLADFVLFAGRHYSAIQWVPFGAGASTRSLIMTPLFPLTVLLAAAATLLERGGPWREPGFRAAAWFALTGWLTAYPRPDIVHIGFTLPLALPLLASALDKIHRRISSPWRWLVPALVTVAMVPSALAALRQTLRMPAQLTIETERGRIEVASYWSTNGQNLRDLVRAVQRAPREDGFFFYPFDPMLPYLTGRRHVAKLDILMPAYTTAEQYREVCNTVLERARWVVIDKPWRDPEYLKQVFPAMPDPSPAAKQALETALATAYTVELDNPRFALLHRKEGAAGACP
ncbi:hypothetical protein [Candidatus Methylocalor cossyra]|uniref:Glycosyltransferase RgtA/B/C/D-like domain-containing protein n=1 Tax=Candidatus Methylocalor cossyra TaxID=3108543 RepID=A0ABM9NFQ5_9GAMM